MPETKIISYSFKDLAALMVRDQNIVEGFWGVYVRFGLGATNAGQSDSDLKPTAMVPVVEIGLQRFEEVNNLSVDAAEVNPKSKAVTHETARQVVRATASKVGKKN